LAVQRAPPIDGQDFASEASRVDHSDRNHLQQLDRVAARARSFKVDAPGLSNVSKTTLILKEALCVAVAGVAFAVAGNAVSPRGLRLTRDYFPAGTPTVRPADGNGTTAAKSDPVSGSALPSSDQTVERLSKRGLRVVTLSTLVQLFQDPKYSQGQVVFVDARDNQHYAAGHIPGAWQFHHYRAEDYLATVLPVCLVASQVVVYCSGGDCEDSEFAAILLRDAGVPAESLSVFPGGITEWKASDLPVEVGARDSGELLGPKR
jgi:rhodanese-related sulfurtransferase